MPIHVFVDEIKSRGFLMAAARCSAGDVGVNRKALRSLLLPGQERLHFRTESNQRRKKILQVVTDFRLLVDLYPVGVNSHEARRRCLDAIVRDTATSAEILTLLDDLHASGVTIVLITHDQAVAQRAGRLATIKDGRLEETPAVRFGG